MNKLLLLLTSTSLFASYPPATIALQVMKIQEDEKAVMKSIYLDIRNNSGRKQFKKGRYNDKKKSVHIESKWINEEE